MIILDNDSNDPLYLQIYEQVKKRNNFQGNIGEK